MLITIKQTVDPAVLDKDLDDGLGTSKGIIALKASGASTLRDLLHLGWKGMAYCPGVGGTTISNIRDWVRSKNLPWNDDGCSPSLLKARSKTATYEVPLTGIEKCAEKVLCELAEHPEGPSQYRIYDLLRVPMTEVEGGKVGTIRIRIEMEIEWDEDSE